MTNLASTNYEKSTKILEHPAVQFGILSVLVFLLIFVKLGSFPMRWWDESMFAVNTGEMMENGHYFSLYYNGAPDLFNTKPPLTNWFQIISVHIFGYTEFALRFPSALAASLSVLLLFQFIRTYFNTTWAWIAALILVCSPGFIGFHTARTADSDALLSFFILVANLHFIQYFIDKKRLTLFWFLLFITLAFATKLYAALLFVPAYLFILIYTRKLKSFLTNGPFLLGILFFIVSVVLLVVLREAETPGYLDQILFKDAWRLFKVVEFHKESTLYFIDLLFESHFSLWAILFLVGSILIFIVAEGIKRLILLICFSLILSYLLIITLSITKLAWYDMPLYPYLALIAAYPLVILVQKILPKTNSILRNRLLIALIFSYPLIIGFTRSQKNDLPYGEQLLEANEYYICHAIREGKNLDGITVFHKGWNGSLLFYQRKLALENQTIELCPLLNELELGDTVLVCDEDFKAELHATYSVRVLDEKRTAQLVILEPY